MLRSEENSETTDALTLYRMAMAAKCPREGRKYFDQLYRHNILRVFNMVFSMYLKVIPLKNGQELSVARRNVEDLCQEIFLELWAENMKIEGKFFGYLKKMAYNKILNALRSRRVEERYHDNTAITHEDAVMSEFEHQADFEHLQQQIQQMAGNDAHYVMQMSVMGYSNKEIGNMMGKSTKRIANIKSMTRKLLAQISCFSLFTLLVDIMLQQ